jgi:hypothetical protein
MLLVLLILGFRITRVVNEKAAFSKGLFGISGPFVLKFNFQRAKCRLG